MSVPANIAEGYGRYSKGDYLRFLHISLGSLRELDTELIIAKEVGLIDEKTLDKWEEAMKEVDEMQRIMVSTLQKLES